MDCPELMFREILAHSRQSVRKVCGFPTPHLRKLVSIIVSLDVLSGGLRSLRVKMRSCIGRSDRSELPFQEERGAGAAKRKSTERDGKRETGRCDEVCICVERGYVRR